MGYLQHPATDSLPYPRGRNGTTGQAEPLKHKNRKANPKGWLFVMFFYNIHTIY